MPTRFKLGYTIVIMLAHHVLLELRTGRDSLHTPEAAVQLFSALPVLKNNWFHHLRSRSEHISVELVVSHQSIFFQACVPSRLSDYFQSALAASYPEILITPLQHDAVADLITPSNLHESQLPRHLSTGWLSLKNAQYLPLKTYHEFTDIDPLAPLLSTMSKLDDLDRVVIQYLLAPDNEAWKRSGQAALDAASKNGGGQHPQKSAIEQKINASTVKVSVRLAVSSPTKERSQLLLETIVNPYQTVSQSAGNALQLKRAWLLPNHFLKQMESRRFGRSETLHLTLAELATFLHLPNKRHSSIPNIAWGKTVLGEPPENLPVKSSDTADDSSDLNVFGRTLFKNAPAIYGVKRADRRRHMYVIGKTGTGKSTLLANMAINDLKNGEGICVVDPHGDLVETLLDYIPAKRINDVVYFNPSDVEKTVQINLFEGKNVVHRELIASGIISIFQKLYGYSWGPRLEYILRNALLTLLKVEGSRLSDILDLLTNPLFRAKIVAQLDDQILKNFWVDEYDQMSDKLRTESIASILNKVGQFVSSPLVRNVVNAQKSSFDIEDIMDKGKILLVNLSQGRLGEDNATLLGAMLITKIQLAAMARVHTDEADRRDFYLYVDEFQNFATEAFNKILSEARKYRLNIILANQYVAQIPESVQKAIFGNCGNIVSFVMGADDANVFAKEYGELYTREDLVSLGKYQIINKISIDNVISRPFPALTLDLAKNKNGNREKVIKVSRERYAKTKESYQVEASLPKSESSN